MDLIWIFVGLLCVYILYDEKSGPSFRKKNILDPRSHMIYQCDNSDFKNNNKAYMKKPPLPMKGSKFEPMLGTHDH